MTPLDKLRAEMEELKHYHRSCGCSGVIEDLADRLLKAAEVLDLLAEPMPIDSGLHRFDPHRTAKEQYAEFERRRLRVRRILRELAGDGT